MSPLLISFLVFVLLAGFVIYKFLNIKEYDSNSFIAKYYKFMFNGNLPNNFCVFFWNTLISIIVFPVAISAAFPLWKDEGWDDRSLFIKWLNGLLTWVISLIVSVTGVKVLDGFGFHFWKSLPLLVVYPLGIISLAVFFALVILAIVVVFVLPIEGYRELRDRQREREWTKIKGEPQIPKESKLSLIWNTIRNKYCTKITWK